MEELKKKLLTYFTDLTIQIHDDYRMCINTQKETVVSLLNYLKNMGYEHLALLSCIDWIDKGEFELIYILSAYMEVCDKYQEKEQGIIIIKARISRNDAKIISVINVFENAEPYERELHEMFGIKFEGHPRLTPLMLEREYEIPPFRKDFDTLKYVDNTFGKIPSIEERKANYERT